MFSLKLSSDYEESKSMAELDDDDDGISSRGERCGVSGVPGHEFLFRGASRRPTLFSAQFQSRSAYACNNKLISS